MKRDSINYLLVGGVVLLALAIAFVVGLHLTGGTGASDDYHANYRSVAGLRFGTPVYYEGYRIGEVREITPRHEGGRTDYRVDFAVQADWPIPDDSIAQIAADGLLADVMINIREGSSDRLLAPGSEIPALSSADVFTAINDLAVDVRQLTDSHIRPLLDLLATRVDAFSASLIDSTPRVTADLESLLQRLNRAGAAVNELLGPQNRESVATTLSNLQSTSANLEQISVDLAQTRMELDSLLVSSRTMIDNNSPDIRESVIHLRSVTEQLDARVDSMMFQLDQASRNLNEFTRSIRRNPGRLIYTAEEDEQ